MGRMKKSCSGYFEQLLAFKRGYWSEMLDRHRSIAAAALAAGVNRTYLHKLVRQIGVRIPATPTAHRGNWGTLHECRSYRRGVQAARNDVEGRSVEY